TSGALPLTIHASAEGTKDPDRDALKYSWDFGDGKKVETDSAAVSYTFNTAGAFPVNVTVSDGKGGESKSTITQVYAGNTMPEVRIRITGGNPVFYFPNQAIDYQVQVSDPEDGNSDAPAFDQSRVFVQAS